MARLAGAALALALLAPGCFGAAQVTESGKALPTVEVEFPDDARPSSLEKAVFIVTNPGPGDMQGVDIAFARVGNDYPIIDVTRPAAVVEVEPRPRSVDATGTVYRFALAAEDAGATPAPPLLSEGESVTFTFVLRLPERRGVVANSVTISASEDVERIRGVRLETELR